MKLENLQRTREDLLTEKTRIDAALEAINTLLAVESGRKGASKVSKKRPQWSPEARKKAAARMKAYWAGRAKKSD